MTFESASDFDAHREDLRKERVERQRLWQTSVDTAFPDLSPRRRRQISEFAREMVIEALLEATRAKDSA